MPLREPVWPGSAAEIKTPVGQEAAGWPRVAPQPQRERGGAPAVRRRGAGE